MKKQADALGKALITRLTRTVESKDPSAFDAEARAGIARQLELLEEAFKRLAGVR